MVSVMTSVLSNGWKAEKEWWILRLEGQLAFVTPVWPLPCFLLVFLEHRNLIWTGQSLVLPAESEAWFPIIWNYLTANFSERMVGEHESSEESLEKPRLRQADLRSLCMCKGVIIMLVSELGWVDAGYGESVKEPLLNQKQNRKSQHRLSS